MTTVNVGYGTPDPTHDLSVSDGSTTLGLIFAGGPRVLQEVPLSPPAQAFEIEQKNWIGGRGRIRYDDDPTGYNDAWSLWSMSNEKVMPMLQWRFAKGIRNNDTLLPDNAVINAWWKLYGNTPASKISRYLSTSFVASATYNADKAYLWIRRRGTPGTLTLELCQDSTGVPGTVLKTVTVTTTNITDTVSVFHLFDWTSTQGLTSGTTYHLKIYGADTDSSANHWEVLGDDSGAVSTYSADGAAWSAASISMYYRVTDTDSLDLIYFFTLEGGMYCVSLGGSLKQHGVRGTATSGTTTSLVCSGLTMTTNRFRGAYLRIIDGTNDGTVRIITDNDATSFTVSTPWGGAPDTTSKFVVYFTDWFQTVTGTPGLTAPITGAPAVAGNIAYIPQSINTNIRRMRVNGASHDFADDGTNKASHIYLNSEGTAPLIFTSNSPAATIQSASVVGWGTNLTLSTAKSIGGSEYRIINLFAHNKTMYVFKEDGIYSYNNGIVERLGLNFADAPDRNTGRGVAAQAGALWFGWNHSLERMIGSSVDDMLNYKLGYEGFPSNRTGYIHSIISAVGWLFFVINGGSQEQYADAVGYRRSASNYSSVICWNGIGFHEVFRSFSPGQQIYNIYWQPQVDARGRLWINISGDLVYIDFPLYAANPLKDPYINYQHEGVLVTSTYDAHDQNLYKILSLLRVFTESGTVEVDYQTNANVGTNNWTVLDTADTQPVDDLSLNLGGVLQVRFRFRLQVATSSSPTVLTGWQLSGRQMPLDKYQYLVTCKVDSDGTTFTDEPDHDPNTVYTQLQTWASTQTKLTMRSGSYSADNKIVTVSLPSKSVDWIDSQENKWGGRISAAILEV